jgi:hypothetical protein
MRKVEMEDVAFTMRNAWNRVSSLVVCALGDAITHLPHACAYHHQHNFF